VPFRPHQYIEVALVRRATHSSIEIEFIGRACARKLAQAPQSQLDVTGAKFNLIIQILELAAVPNLDGAEVAVFILAYAHAFRIIAIGAKWRSAGRSDPFVAALVPSFLFGETLAQCLQELVETTHGLDKFLFFVGKEFFRELFEPFGRNFDKAFVRQQLETFEHPAKDAVKLVEVPLVLDKCGTRQKVKILHSPARNVPDHGLHQGQIFTQAYRHASGLEFIEKGDEHDRAS